MKFDSLFNNRSFIAILALLIFISGFSCTSVSAGVQKNQALDIIQNQLDDLINKLEKNNLNNIQPMMKDSDTKEIISAEPIIKGLDFSDEVIEAFQSLNHDFLEYENILSNDSSVKDNKDSSDHYGVVSAKFQQEKNRIKNLYQQNEENFKKICNLHSENHVNNADITINKDKNNSFSKKYYEEIESLTSDISKSFDTFDKLEKVEEKKKIVNEKLVMIKQMKETISQMKEKIDAIKNKKNVLSEKRQNIKEISENILGLYNKYLNLEKTINLKAREDLEKIKIMVAESNKSNGDIQKYFTVYDEIMKFFNKIDLQENELIEQSKVEEIKDRFETLGKFISKINESDRLSNEIRTKIERNLEVIKLNSLHIPAEKRVSILNKYLDILKNLKSFNDKILELKNKITDNLKKYSFNSLNDLVNKINEKKTSDVIKHQKLSHVKNTFSLIKNIFEKRNLIQKTKEKIIENIKQVSLVKEELQSKKTHLAEKRQKQLDLLNKNILINNKKLENIQIAKEQINKTKDTLIRLANIKKEEKDIKEHQSFLQNKLQEIKIKKENERREAELKLIEEENLKRQRAQQLKEERNLFFLQKIDEIKKVQNRTENTIQLINMHHDLVNKLVNTLLYLKQLKDTHKHIKENKDRLIILEKIKQARGIIQEMKQVISNTKRIIEQQEENKAIQDGYDSVYKKLIEKVESLKFDLKNSNTGESIDKIREKLKKLTDLYKILKTGSAHNALRNELMKKLVNINSSMLQSVNIFKLQNEISLLK